jgi:hypothetical protein
MSRQFFYSITTNLSRDQVWELLTNIEEWTNFSAIYADLRWSGFPLGSRQLHYGAAYLSDRACLSVSG